MRNRFAGACYQCGGTVEIGAGFFEKIPHSRPARWRVQHRECCHKARIEKQMKSKEKST